MTQKPIEIRFIYNHKFVFICVYIYARRPENRYLFYTLSTSSTQELMNAYNLLDWTNEQIEAYQKFVYEESNQTSTCFGAGNSVRFMIQTNQYCMYA